MTSDVVALKLVKNVHPIVTKNRTKMVKKCLIETI